MTMTVINAAPLLLDTGSPSKLRSNRRTVVLFTAMASCLPTFKSRALLFCMALMVVTSFRAIWMHQPVHVPKHHPLYAKQRVRGAVLPNPPHHHELTSWNWTAKVTQTAEGNSSVAIHDEAKETALDASIAKQHSAKVPDNSTISSNINIAMSNNHNNNNDNDTAQSSTTINNTVSNNTEELPSANSTEPPPHEARDDLLLTNIYAIYPSPTQRLPPNATCSPQPLFGTHRPDRDAIFSMATGLPLKVFVRFIGTLMRANFTGDVVLGVDRNLTADAKAYLKYYPHIVVAYRLDMDCRTDANCALTNFYHDTGNGSAIPDIRQHRPVERLALDYYHQWAQQYSNTSRILLLDFDDAFFQQDPFERLGDMPTTIMAFESNVDNCTNKTMLNVGSTLAGQPAMVAYTSGMLYLSDRTNETLQDLHHHLLYRGRLRTFLNIEHVRQRTGVVNNLGQQSQVQLPIVDAVRNVDGHISPVVHQYKHNDELAAHVSINVTDKLLVEWTNQYVLSTIKNALAGT